MHANPGRWRRHMSKNRGNFAQKAICWVAPRNATISQSSAAETHIPYRLPLAVPRTLAPATLAPQTASSGALVPHVAAVPADHHPSIWRAIIQAAPASASGALQLRADLITANDVNHDAALTTLVRAAILATQGWPQQRAIPNRHRLRSCSLLPSTTSTQRDPCRSRSRCRRSAGGGAGSWRNRVVGFAVLACCPKAALMAPCLEEIIESMKVAQAVIHGGIDHRGPRVREEGDLHGNSSERGEHGGWVGVVCEAACLHVLSFTIRGSS